MSGRYEPEFRWLTLEETVARQKAGPPLSGSRVHSDPTADAAIGRFYRLEKIQLEKSRMDKSRKRREAQLNG